MPSSCSTYVRLCARGLPSSVQLPWLPSSPVSSTAGSSRHFRLLWPLEAECLSDTPGIGNTDDPVLAGSRNKCVFVIHTQRALWYHWCKPMGMNGTQAK